MKINDYRTNLQRYRDYTKLQSGIDFVNEQLQTLGRKKASELLNKILKECNDRAGYASWDFKTFDIRMDGVSKDEKEDGIQGAMLKNGLYQYFINHKGNGQIIIVNNLNVMPDIDLQAVGARVTTYYKNEKDGHVYGFMPNWRKDLPKETE